MTSREKNNDYFRLTALLAVFIIGMTAILGTERNGGRPQVLLFDYALVNPSDAAATIATLNAGTHSISDMLSITTPCKFSVAAATDVDYRLTGAIGQTGSMAKIAVVNPMNAITTNAGSCPSVDDLLIEIGSVSGALNLHAEQSKTKAKITVGGNLFSSETGFFRATVDSYDTSDRHMTGGFEFLAKQIGGGYIAIVGSYGGSP